MKNYLMKFSNNLILLNLHTTPMQYAHMHMQTHARTHTHTQSVKSKSSTISIGNTATYLKEYGVRSQTSVETILNGL